MPAGAEREVHMKDTAVNNALEELGDRLDGALEETEQELRLQFERLARESGAAAPDRELDRQVQERLEEMKEAKRSLLRSYQRLSALEDELAARFRDMKKSRDRRWYRRNPPANGAIDLQERKLDHFARGTNCYKLMLVCLVGSFAGVVVEMAWCLFRYGYIESRAGLVYGPFNLLYGFGAVVLTVTLYRFRNRGWELSFLGGMVVGSAVEYVCSWGQEVVLGSRSWDYSAMPLNLNGRICLLYSAFWGVLGVLWIKDIYPRMAKWILKLPNRMGKVLTWCAAIFLVVNSLVSLVSVYRWSERVRDVPPSGVFWEMVDERFPDERMERIFANMRFAGPEEE